MTDHERLMYEVLTRISVTDAPIVFKGALITKLILAEREFSLLERNTADIDANWTDTPPSMDDLADTIQNALADMQDQFYAEPVREYGKKSRQAYR